MIATEIGTDLHKAKAILESGQLVALPTETVYGLAANALNETAVAKIFEVKNRPSFNPLIVHIKDSSEIFKYSKNLAPLSLRLAEKFMPGPLTLLVEKKDIIPDIVTSGLNTVGLRVPAHELTRTLLKMLAFPLAAPSANPFGYISPTSAQHVADQLGGKIPYILDGGDCPVGIESTIVEALDNEIIIHRLGGIALEDLKAICPKITSQIRPSLHPTTPGKLGAHYAPQKTLIFTPHPEEIIEQFPDKKIAVITFCKDTFAGATAFPLSLQKNLPEAAAKLFSTLRYLDKSDFNLIIAEEFPKEGLGHAINDRLKRASQTELDLKKTFNSS
jgi:L-threonylcarbamoyladenylate synthase